MIEATLWLGALLVFLFVGLVLARRYTHRIWSDGEYEQRRRSGTAVGNAFLATRAILDPGAQHALGQRTVERAEDSESGAPPDPSDETKR